MVAELLPYVAVAILAIGGIQASTVVFPVGDHPQLRWAVLSPFEWVALAALIMFAGTRQFVGTDYDLYASLFNRLYVGDWSGAVADSPQEFGYTVFALVLRSGGFSEHVLFLSMSLITVAVAYVGIRSTSIYPAASVAIYVLFANYLAPMNTVRQGLAVALCFLAISLWQRKRSWALILLFLAFSFHYSAIIAMVLFFVIRVIRMRVILLLALVVIAGLGARILTAFPAVLVLLGTLNERYVSYVASTDVAGFGTVLVALFHVAFAIILLRSAGFEGQFRWYRSIYCLTGPLALLGTTIPIATRLSEYSAIFLTLAIVPVLKNSKRSGLAVVIIITVGSAYYLAYLLNYGGLLPYHSWFFASFKIG